jgi:hypothetical protein
MVQFVHHRLTIFRCREHDRAINADDTDRQITRLRQAQDLDTVAGMYAETSHLHND